MNLLILGATGGTGRALEEQALEQGLIVTAFARDPSKVRTTQLKVDFQTSGRLCCINGGR